MRGRALSSADPFNRSVLSKVQARFARTSEQAHGLDALNPIKALRSRRLISMAIGHVDIAPTSFDADNVQIDSRIHAEN
jgi:hypothetical protein